jgi:hypothetical protein
VVLNDGKTKEYLGLLSNQIHALHLLLTAFQWQVWSSVSSFSYADLYSVEHRQNNCRFCIAEIPGAY